jgi:hypothetical protein
MYSFGAWRYYLQVNLPAINTNLIIPVPSLFELCSKAISQEQVDTIHPESRKQDVINARNKPVIDSIHNIKWTHNIGKEILKNK